MADIDASTKPGTVDQATLEKVEEYIEQEEGAQHRFGGAWGYFLFLVAVAMSLFHLYAAYGNITTTTLRYAHVGFVLFLAFTLFPWRKEARSRFSVLDLLLAIASVATLAYAVWGGDDFLDRSTAPDQVDTVLGIALVVLVLEAARRTTGWIMPLVCVAFIAYAMVGPWLPAPWTHRGYDIGRLVGTMYMTLEGIFGTAVDVSSTLIILFTIYGAILQFSGAGKFYLDFSFAALGGKATGAGRTIVLSSFLLGGPSGSGVATTVTLGTVAYPMLAKAGYEKNAAGGLLAAGGLGAILSPPVLGAAAFLIAEFLKLSYLDVIKMAAIPTCLYYLSLFFMVEIDARKYGMRMVEIERGPSAWELTKRQGFHFFSLIAIVVFMLIGFSPIGAVFWSTVVAVLTSFLNRETALVDFGLFRKPPSRWIPEFLGSRLIKALEAGSTGMINIGATCAAAGLIVGVVTLTGLGLRFSEIVIGYAGGNLVLTAVFTALIVWVVGLAVPVTASYIICAVIAAPALMKLGVPDFAAHMFIFYYAVLSEVSPPTALSPFAAAAITGGDPYKTTLQSWKYTLPAFVVPFIFVLDPLGTGLLLNLPKGAGWFSVVEVTVMAIIALAALSGAAEGWLFERTPLWQRLMLLAAGLLLLAPKPLYDAIGIALIAIVVAAQLIKPRARAAH
ncbi:MAG: TRAP transporter fused permease subunit [Betaproteobacteria bacterium]|nr:TRAP transporter fused permease subunit [Betaproteobacteria bacterium]